MHNPLKSSTPNVEIIHVAGVVGSVLGRMRKTKTVIPP